HAGVVDVAAERAGERANRRDQRADRVARRGGCGLRQLVLECAARGRDLRGLLAPARGACAVDAEHEHAERDAVAQGDRDPSPRTVIVSSTGSPSWTTDLLALTVIENLPPTAPANSGGRPVCGSGLTSSVCATSATRNRLVGSWPKKSRRPLTSNSATTDAGG